MGNSCDKPSANEDLQLSWNQNETEQEEVTPYSAVDNNQTKTKKSSERFYGRTFNQPLAPVLNYKSRNNF